MPNINKILKKRDCNW